MLPILLGVTIVVYAYGLCIAKTGIRSKGLLAFTIVLLLLPLLSFKYLDFLMDSTTDLL